MIQEFYTIEYWSDISGNQGLLRTTSVFSVDKKKEFKERVLELKDKNKLINIGKKTVFNEENIFDLMEKESIIEGL